MKFNLNLNLSPEELASSVESAVNKAVALTSAKLANKAQEEASKKLKSGLKHWRDGFYLRKVSEGEWIVGIDGLLANWMEDGINPGEISDKLLESKNVKTSKSGKKYIDVPMALDADSLGQSIKSKQGQSPKQVVSKIELSSFRNANDLVRSFGRNQASARRATDGIIKNVKKTRTSQGLKTSEISFVSIRRVGENSKWPKVRFPGAQVLKFIESRLEVEFERNLNKMLSRL